MAMQAEQYGLEIRSDEEMIVRGQDSEATGMFVKGEFVVE